MVSVTVTRHVAAFLLAGLTMGAAACAAPVPQPDWHFVPVELPAGAVPGTVAALDDSLLIAGQDGPKDSTMHLLRQGEITAIPLQAATGDGEGASWTSVVTTGDSIAGLAGARGGAHGNVRWTVWSGKAGGISEQEQLFDTFGGWGAGYLTGLVAGPGGEVGVIGSWESAAGGQDIAVWQPAGSRYVRLPSAGTPLASTATEQVSPIAAVGVPDGIVIVGNATALGTELRVAPVLWHAPALEGPWTRVDLPTNSKMARARAVSCVSTTQCVVIGTAGDLLAGWEVNNANAGQVDVPELQVAAQESATVVDGEPGPLGMAVADGRLRVFEVGSLRTSLGPPVRGLQAAVRVGESVYLVLEDPSGTPVLLRGTHG